MVDTETDVCFNTKFGKYLTNVFCTKTKAKNKYWLLILIIIPVENAKPNVAFQGH